MLKLASIILHCDIFYLKKKKIKYCQIHKFDIVIHCAQMTIVRAEQLSSICQTG